MKFFFVVTWKVIEMFWKFVAEIFVRTVLSLVCGIICFFHFVNSGFKADWMLFAFVVLGAIPWLGNIFESIGGEKWNIKWRAPRQGKTVVGDETVVLANETVALETNVKPVGEPLKTKQPQSTAPAPPPEPQSPLAGFDFPTMKVLATLWKYQKIHFGYASQNRWTFILGPGSEGYEEFLAGFMGLASRGFAKLAVNNGQIALTEAGYEFCKQNDALLSSWNFTYDRFSN